MLAPSFRALKPILFSTLAIIALVNPCFANETVPYICTPEGETNDAVANYETVGGGQVIHLATIKGGNSDAGIALAAIPYPPAEFTSLAFALQGYPDKGHGPYLIMEGNYKNGTTGTIAVDITKTKDITGENNGFSKYKIVRNDVGLGYKTFHPLHIYLQVYAGPNAASSFNFYGFYYNGAGFTPSYPTVHDCYVGTTAP